MVIAALIVTYQTGRDLLDECIDSLVRAKSSGFKVDIFVIDNSPKSSDSYLHNRSEIKYFANGKNVGFGAGMNLLITKFNILEEYSHVFLVNPDLKLADNFWDVLYKNINKIDIDLPLIPLILFKEHIYTFDIKNIKRTNCDEIKDVIFNNRPIDFIDTQGNYSKLVPTNGKLERLVLTKEQFELNRKKEIAIQIKTKTFQSIKTKPEEWNQSYIVNNFGSFAYEPWICGDRKFGKLFENDLYVDSGMLWSGACVLLPSEFFKQVGLFDENFFLYYEDTDLALRGALEGKLAICHPDLVAFHVHSYSTSRNSIVRNKNILRSSTYFAIKHLGFRLTLIAILRELIFRNQRVRRLGIAALRIKYLVYFLIILKFGKK